MSLETELRQGSLVLYKGKPARVAAVSGKKIEITLEENQRLSVRPKDVTLLHPGPLDRLADLLPIEGEMQTAWELLAGRKTSLREVTELAFGAYTPRSAWAAWQVVADGLLFSGDPRELIAHTEAEVAAQLAAREARAAEARDWESFKQRLEQGKLLPDDEQYLQDVVALSLGRQETSRTLKGMGQPETPENAHALLLRSGFWSELDNPYPHRAGVALTVPEVFLPELPVESRRDFTHLVALAIDDEGSRDPDDAISFEDGRLWVHIADVGALVPPGSEADSEARGRAANLYLPEGTVPMLPPDATRMLGLGLMEVSPALSFGIDLGPSGEVLNVDIVPSWIRATRMTYEEAEACRAEKPLREIATLTDVYRGRRAANGAIEIELPEVNVRVDGGRVVIRPVRPLKSRLLVQEAMLMTGEAVARFAERQEIAMPYTSQDPPAEEVPPAQTMSEMFARRRLMKASSQSSKPGAHAGLGLSRYCQATSPLRRYLDLVVHQQLRAFLQGRELLSENAIVERIGATDAVAGSLRWAERRSTHHWTLVFLLQNRGWRGDGVLVEKKGRRNVFLIPDLELETQLYSRRDLPLDAVVTLEVQEISLPRLEANFRIVWLD